MGRGTEARSGCCESEPLIQRSTLEQDKLDEQSKCKIRCDEDFAIEVKRPVKTCETCGSGFKHFCCNLHWWLLSCVLNALLFPVVFTYHTIVLYVGPCIMMYLEMGCCKIFSAICCGCCFVHTDKEFPPNRVSLGSFERQDLNAGADPSGKIQRGDGCCDIPDYNEPGATIAWYRVEDVNYGDSLEEGERPILVADGIRPDDIKQGGLGNCWLLAGLSCLADHDGKIEGCFKNHQFSERGRYTFRLWHPGQGMKNISVDSYIPCHADSKTPISAKPNGKEMWAMLLEKAFAKHPLYGSYGTLDEGGLPCYAMKIVTGKPTYSWRILESGEWKQTEVRCGSSDPPKLGLYSTDVKKNSDDVFDDLAVYVKNGYTIAAGTEGQDTSRAGGISQNAKDLGIVPGHAYSVLDVRAFDGVKLVNLRNPWGTFTWKGKWAEGDSAWEENPSIASSCLTKDEDGADKIPSQSDGAFWMEWNEFLQFYDIIDVCFATKSMREIGMRNREDKGFCGPCCGCCWDCTKFFACCYGCRVLYCNKICPMDDRTQEGGADLV